MKNIINASFIFAAAETATAAAPAVAAEVKKTPTQFTVNTTKNDKEFIADLVEEFELKNTMEAVALLRSVAEGQRFYKRQAVEIVEIDGAQVEQPVFDSDGNPLMETGCRWEDVAKEIHAGRSDAKAEKEKAKLLEKLKALGVNVSKLKL